MEAIRSFPGNFVQRHILAPLSTGLGCCLTLRAAVVGVDEKNGNLSGGFLFPGSGVQ